MDYLLILQQRRREHLKRLLADYRTQREFGEATGLAVNQISHILNGVREMGEEIARRIESALGKPLGWMDADPDRKLAPETALGNLSADQTQLLHDYRQLSPQRQAALRETLAGYVLLEQRQQRKERRA
ncbi:MAG: helix-turn-helix transcriptional regulator [Candidatus Competibacteraceae bacterium]|nr:helix-turn-helix transcriptional regulator [Candidatus Competibacteraceae bacterium]